MATRKTGALKAPEAIKKTVQSKAEALIESVIKPKYLKAPPEGVQFNYLVDIYAKWHRHYFYFCARYHSPGPHALSPSFDTKFARMEYLSNGHYTLAYMRYTEQWWELYHDIPLDEALQHVGDEPDFFP